MEPTLWLGHICLRLCTLLMEPRTALISLSFIFFFYFCLTWGVNDRLHLIWELWHSWKIFAAIWHHLNMIQWCSMSSRRSLVAAWIMIMGNEVHNDVVLCTPYKHSRSNTLDGMIRWLLWGNGYGDEKNSGMEHMWPPSTGAPTSHFHVCVCYIFFHSSKSRYL